MENWRETVISEYANSPTINGLILALNDAIDPAANIDDFYNFVWNVDTAKGYGLDVWGRIVGVSRILTVPTTGNIGFQQAGSPSAVPLGQGPWYRAGATSNYALTDDAFRLLILIKALANISNCSYKTLNKILMQMFPGRGNCYVHDLGNMKMLLTFEFFLEPFEFAILQQSGAFPRPTGVDVFILQCDTSAQFGFKQAGGTPLGQGNFFLRYSHAV